MEDGSWILDGHSKSGFKIWKLEVTTWKLDLKVGSYYEIFVIIFNTYVCRGKRPFFLEKIKKIELVKPANEQTGASGIISRGVGV